MAIVLTISMLTTSASVVADSKADIDKSVSQALMQFKALNKYELQPRIEAKGSTKHDLPPTAFERQARNGVIATCAARGDSGSRVRNRPGRRAPIAGVPHE